jgi:hypothetical protein
VFSFLLSPSHPPHSISQELVLFTLSIPSGHMSARLVELLVPHNPSSNPSSTTRRVSSLLLPLFSPVSDSTCFYNPLYANLIRFLTV